MNAHGNHLQYCAAICSLQEIETRKQLKTCVYGVDSDKLPYKVRRKLVKLVGSRPLVKFLLNGKHEEGLWDSCEEFVRR